MTERANARRSLTSLRRDLEEIDRAIVLLVAARIESAGAAIRFRLRHGENVSNPVQEARVIARAQEWARQLGVSPVAVETIFRAIVRAGKDKFGVEAEFPAATPCASVRTLRRVRARSSLAATDRTRSRAAALG